MRVIIADDTLPFARGLADMLTEIDIEVLAIARDTEELMAAVDRDPPDVAIIDISMPHAAAVAPPSVTDEGLHAAELLGRTHPKVGVLVISAYDEEGWAARLLHLRGHAVGYLQKRNLDDKAVRDALRRIRSGGVAIDADISARLFAQRSTVRRLDLLSDREQEVLRYMAQGRTNAGIGQLLGISERTVEKYTRQVFLKLGLGESDGHHHRRVLAVLEWLGGGRGLDEPGTLDGG